jgi:hypothetical protein
LQVFDPNSIASTFGAVQIGFSECLRDGLRISLFETGGKASEACGFRRHGPGFVEKLMRAVGRRTRKASLKVGEMRRQPKFESPRVNLGRPMLLRCRCRDAMSLGGSNSIVLFVVGAPPLFSQDRHVSELVARHRLGRRLDFDVLGVGRQIGPERECALFIADRHRTWISTGCISLMLRGSLLTSLREFIV